MSATTLAAPAASKPRQRRPETCSLAFVRALVTADLDAAGACFVRDACFITPDATAIRGREDIRAVLAQLIAMRPRIAVETRSVLQGGDAALLTERWRIALGPDSGAPVRCAEALFVARRVEQAWKLAVAAPWGWGTRRAATPVATALLAAALALAVAGCGSGGGSSTSTQGAAAPTEAATTPAGQGASTEASGGRQGKSGSGGKSAGGGEGSNGGRPSHYEGGEKSIEDYGSEAEGSDREALLSSFHTYLAALAAKDYATACSYVTKRVQRSLEQFVTPALRRKGCAAILPKLLSPTAAAIARQQAAGRVTKVRVKGAMAFVVFHAPGAKLYQLTMAREGGAWKATTVAASVLVPSLATLGQ